MKKIIWRPHAQERLMERGIDRKSVQSAVEQPDQIILLDRRRIIHKRYYNSHRHKEYLLRIFIDEHSEEQIIRTVYRISKINKYWRDDL